MVISISVLTWSDAVEEILWNDSFLLFERKMSPSFSVCWQRSALMRPLVSGLGESVAPMIELSEMVHSYWTPRDTTFAVSGRLWPEGHCLTPG